MNRRTFLTSTAIIPVAALGVSGCAGFEAKFDSVMKDVVEYGQAIYNGLKSMWLQLRTTSIIQLLPENTRTSIETGGLIVEDLLTQLKVSNTAAAAQPIVDKLALYAAGILGALSTIPGLPLAVTGLILAAQTVIPVLKSLVGLGIATIAQIQAAKQAKIELLAAPT